ncbi:hypothetical protein [Shewanella polaris]|uniref:Uncharacterized protein n=1 Tax=Shewanella polaris TaxID=2588449 RepID=A0A4Y5YBG1_9GAMM|nr:hypothetical protein [Shewanella polaris]QDE29929.1 hypothetical protein FH971_02455 [Shewanella polaris]
MKKIIMLSFFMTLNGCSADETVKSADTDKVLTKPVLATLVVDDTNKSHDMINNSDDFIKTKPEKNMNGINSSKYTIQLNNHKFTVKDLVLKMNQSVYDMNINSFAIVKGSIVVISSVEPENLAEDFDINKIAKDTYKLTIKSSDQDLYYWYKKLSGDSQYSVVELELDYSPKNSLQSY